MNRDTLGSGESSLETIISYLLIIGVIVSLLLEIVGISLWYYSAGNLAISQDKTLFIQGHDVFSFIYHQFQRGHTEGSAIFLITLGIIALILTPYVRIIASVIYFGWRKNLKYVMITLFVLAVVTLSLALH
ncbi:MAG: DUF1634 domain-containing protein [Chloroflexota bacterium]|nr:DUF1634 domain-containing protein [Chloroflexota bacterium]